MIKEEEYSEHDLREEIIGDSESGSDGDSSNGGEQFMHEDNLPHSIGTAQGYRSDQAVYAPSGHPTLGRQSDRRRAEDPRPSEPLFYSPRQHFKKVSEITSTRSDAAPPGAGSVARLSVTWPASVNFTALPSSRGCR